MSNSTSVKKLFVLQLGAVNDGGSHWSTKTVRELAILTAVRPSVSQVSLNGT